MGSALGFSPFSGYRKLCLLCECDEKNRDLEQFCRLEIWWWLARRSFWVVSKILCFWNDEILSDHKDPEDETSSSLWEMQDNRQSWWHNLQEEGWVNKKRHCNKIQVQRLSWESSPWQLESNTEAQGIFTAEEYLMHCPWKKHQSWLPWCQDCNTTELGCHWVPEKTQKAALKNTSFSSWCFPE